MKLAVETQDATVIFGGQTIALDKVSVKLSQGKITGFIGPSGAGKTTLMRSIVGRQKLSDGSIKVMDEPAGSANLRQQLSYKTQELSVYSDLTISENLNYFAKMIDVPRKKRRQQVDKIIETLDLSPQARQVVATLSGGQKQRVSLAVSLLGSPRILVLDEPTVGLDPILRDELWKLFRDLRDKGTTLIISSHVMEEAERCDELLLIRDGRAVVFDTPAAIRKMTKSSSVEESFLKLARQNESN